MDDEDRLVREVEARLVGPRLLLHTCPRQPSALATHSRVRLKELEAKLIDLEFLAPVSAEDGYAPGELYGLCLRLARALRRYDSFNQSHDPRRHAVDWRSDETVDGKYKVGWKLFQT